MFNRWRLPLGVWLMGSVMVAFGMLVVVRLLHIQLLQSAVWIEQANQNRSFRQAIPAERGVLLDRYGERLVGNQRVYLALSDPAQVWSQTTHSSRESALSLIATGSGLTPVSYQLQRQSLSNASLAHAIGYVGPVTAEILAKKPELPVNELVGRSGLEQRFDELLRGTQGFQEYEVTALGQKQRVIGAQPPRPGQSIATTFDPFLSDVAAAALGDKKGVAIIFSVANGEVLALVNQPSFDPNVFQSVTEPGSTADLNRRTAVESYFQDERQPLFNRALSGMYPPGSIFKLITGLAGLTEGKITAQTTVEDTGILKVGEYAYANWYFTQYGRTEGAIQLERAIARSNDIYFYKAAEAVGPQALAEWSARFGLGQPVGIELAGEAKGLVPDPVWKEQKTGERWYLGNTFHFGIGQGDLLVTPLQVAQLIQTIANDGKNCRLHIVGDKSPDCHSVGVSTEHLRVIQLGMLQACSPGGTAFPFFAINQSVPELATQPVSIQAALQSGAVACKTGTAEFGGTINAAGHRKTHGWFVSFFDTRPLTKVASTQANQATQSATLADKLQGTSVSSASAQREGGTDRLAQHDQWLAGIAARPLPESIGIVVLIESQPEQPFIEGSRDAAPVAKAIYDWMKKGISPRKI